MTQFCSVLLFFGVCCLLLGTLLQFHSRATALARVVSGLITLALLASTAYLLVLLCPSPALQRFLYGVYFALLGWFFRLLLRFSAVFCGVCSKPPQLSPLLSALTALDSLLLLCGLWLPLPSRLPLLLHQALCSGFLLCAVAVLVVCQCRAPRFYRPTYACVYLPILLTFLVQQGFLSAKLPVDPTLPLYALFTVLLGVLVMAVLPKRLTLRLSALFLESAPNAVVLFDREGRHVYHNRMAQARFDGLMATESFFAASLRLPQQPLPPDCKREVLYRDLESQTEYALSVHRHLLTEGRGVAIGSYFLIEDVSEERRMLLLRERAAARDKLTGLYNAAYFFERADQLRRTVPDGSHGLLMVNIRQFKLYNEAFGRARGDRLLQALAQWLRERVAGPELLYGRYEADRFLLFLPMTAVQPVWNTLLAFRDGSQTTFDVALYAGLCPVPDSSIPFSALNTAQEGDCRRYAVYDQRLRDALLAEKQLLAHFSPALEQGDFCICVQPQVHSLTRRLVGGEVLVRWHLEGRVISPAEFVPLLEQNHRIHELDRFVWAQSCALVRRLRDQGLETSLSVNLSPQDFYACDVYQTFVALAEEYGIPPRCLKLEITESTIMTDLEKQVQLIRALQERGFAVEMDDFGSGYSSLNALKDIPVDVLKMDMRFFERTGDPARGRKIIEGVLWLAQALGVAVIAEGVKDQTQVDFLSSHGCYCIQGFLYHQPMGVEEFVQFRAQQQYADLLEQGRPLGPGGEE